MECPKCGHHNPPEGTKDNRCDECGYILSSNRTNLKAPKRASGSVVEVITIATFGDDITANLAKQQLEAEGIIAFLADEMTVQMAWYLTVAVGWIKLLVPRSQAEDAMSVLADMTLPNQLVPEDSMELTQEETLSSNHEEEFQTIQDHDDDDVVRLSWADRIVERMFRVAVLGTLFRPLHLYSLWLLIRLFVSRRRVSRNKYWKLLITIILNIPMMIILGVVFIFLIA